jgi:Signal transduction histidine kinase
MKKLAAIFTIFILISVFSYLGWRTIEHEVVMRQTHVKMLAESRGNNIKSMIESLLNQRSVYLNKLAQFINADQAKADNLQRTESDIKNIFIIKNHKLAYLTNNSDSQWSKIIDSIQYDNSILINNNTQSEQYRPESGWYQVYDHLIYWSTFSGTIVGFEISQINFALEVVNLFDDRSLTDDFTLFNNDKLIYTHGDQNADNVMFVLDYPLQNWQLTYYYQQPSLVNLYLLGCAIIVFLVIVIISLISYWYREYTRALRLARQQVSFVGQVSHEFKTPLTNISLYSEMLKEHLEDEPPPVADYIEVISSESKRLTRLVQNILSFNKSAKLNIKPVNLTQLIQQIYTTFKPVLATKSLQLNLLLDQHNPCIINTDADSVMQIVNNFLSNAEKYAAQGKQVDLSLNHKDCQVTISVRDYGNGIADHLLKQIFKPFYRIKSSITEGVSGTGIGLTIANQLAEQLHGTIQVTNCQPGVAFTLVLTE